MSNLGSSHLVPMLRGWPLSPHRSWFRQDQCSTPHTTSPGIKFALILSCPWPWDRDGYTKGFRLRKPTIVGGHPQRHILPSWGLTESTPSPPSNKALTQLRDTSTTKNTVQQQPSPQVCGRRGHEVGLKTLSLWAKPAHFAS